MKIFIASLMFLTGLIFTQREAAAMWVKLTDSELIDQSDIIVSGELIGQTQMRAQPNQPRLTLGVLRVEEVLKGGANQTVVLLALPSSEGPRSSTDLIYRKGQKGLWFLRARSEKDEGIYLADHPQRFLSSKETAQIEAFRKILKKVNP